MSAPFAQPLDPWTPILRELLARIEAHIFDPADPLGFTRRLARDHGWSLSFARGAVRDYGRFCFLVMATSGPVTPSEEVDEAWHQHLTYSRDHWTIWCREVLRAPLHHDPTKGGIASGLSMPAPWPTTSCFSVRRRHCSGLPPIDASVCGRASACSTLIAI